MVRGDFPIRFTEDTGLFGLDFKIIMSRSRRACAATSRGTGLKGSCPGGRGRRAESGGSGRVTLDGRCIRSLVAPGLADLHITYGPSARRQRLQVNGGGEITISGVPLDVTETSPPVGES